MIQNITAYKCKDGWHVVKTETENVGSEGDVLRYMKQNGVKFQKEFSTKTRMYGK
uniref:Uncharacterized protein n=1 Tax=viral metagenome TaxID=1070528 RepID=A0A6M3KNS3_9ZZZZ